MSPDREVSVSMPDGLFCRALRGGVLFFQPRAASVVQKNIHDDLRNPEDETAETVIC